MSSPNIEMIRWNGRDWEVEPYSFRGLKQYRCPGCRWDSSVPENVAKHIAAEHRRQASWGGKTFELHRDRAGTFKCPICAHTHSREAVVAEHYFTFHLQAQAEEKTEASVEIVSGSSISAIAKPAEILPKRRGRKRTNEEFDEAVMSIQDDIGKPPTKENLDRYCAELDDRKVSIPDHMSKWNPKPTSWTQAATDHFDKVRRKIQRSPARVLTTEEPAAE